MLQNNKKKCVIILQARMGATRLPGKPLKNVLGRPLLSYQLERLRRVKFADAIVVATTTKLQDEKIVDFCRKENISVFRGSEEDVLERYYQTAKKFQADVIVRITGDCPLIDPSLVDQVIRYYFDHQPDCDYVSNSLNRSYPRGLDVEVFSFSALERAEREAKDVQEHEHVTPYLYWHPEIFALGSVVQQEDQSHHRWTVDTPEDLMLITKIIETLYPINPAFTTQDILSLLKAHPDWVALNAHIQQKKLNTL